MRRSREATAHSSTPARRSERAFTLIELLVVLSIMTMLMALLMPSLAQAREAARTTACTSNLKQLSVIHFDQAFELDAMPRAAYDVSRDRWSLVSSDPYPAGDSGRITEEFTPPPDRIRQFGRNLYREEMQATKQPPHWKLPCTEAIALDQMSYGMNYMLRGVRPEHVKPVDIVFACSPYRLLVRGRDLYPARHNERVNFLFGDTHIKADSIDMLPDIDKYRKTWRPDPEPAEYPDEMK